MRRVLLSFVLFPLFVAPARSQPVPVSAAPQGLLCRSAIAATERGSRIPTHLLAAISMVESGRRDPKTGAWHPWPWTVNVEGQGYFYDTKDLAVAAVRDFQSKGARSIDVGCMQVNLMHHPDAFQTLEQAFDPQTNVAYAARFLNQLFDSSKDWTKAAGLYHSATPDLMADYQQRVIALWPEEKQRQLAAAQQFGGRGAPAAAPTVDPAIAWAASLPAAPSNRVAVVLPSNRSANIQVIPLSPAGGAVAAGRGLDSYRAAPIALAARQPRFGG